MWRHFLFDVMQHRLIQEVNLVSHTWGARMNGYGSGSSVIDCDKSMTDQEWRDFTRPWAGGILSLWNDRPIYAGIFDRRSEVAGSRQISVQHAEIWKILSRRLAFGIPDYSPREKFWIEGYSLRGIAAWLIKRAASGPNGASPRWPLEVNAGAAEPGNRMRILWAFKFERPMDVLESLIDEEGGPDVWFRPRVNLTTGNVSWLAEVGTPRLVVSGVMNDLISGATDSDVESLTIDQDGSDQATGLFLLGEGSEADMIVGRAGTTPGGLPLPVMDVTESAKMISDTATADRIAAGLLSQRSQLPTQFDIQLNRLALDRGIRPGWPLRLRVENSLLVDAGWRNMFVVSVSGDLSETVKVGVRQ